MHLIHIAAGHLFILSAHDPSRNTHDSTIGRHFLEDDRARADLGVLSDREGSEDLGACAHHNIVLERRMSLPLFLPGPAQGHALVKCDIVSDHGRLSDDDSAPMVNEQPLPDRCARMYLDPGLSGRSLRDPPGEKVMLFQIQLVRQTVSEDDLKARVEQHFHIRFDRGVTLPNHLYLFLDIRNNSHFSISYDVPGDTSCPQNLFFCRKACNIPTE